MRDDVRYFTSGRRFHGAPGSTEECQMTKTTRRQKRTAPRRKLQLLSRPNELRDGGRGWKALLFPLS